jgi:hypothetical protein
MLTLYCFVKYSCQIETLLEVLPDSLVLFAVLHKHLISGCCFHQTLQITLFRSSAVLHEIKKEMHLDRPAVACFIEISLPVQRLKR